jgi:Flp pilus assembly protein TadG
MRGAGVAARWCLRLGRFARVVRGEGGQATVEFVALAPILVGIALLVAGFLAAQRAHEAADQAAVAAAIASLQGRDAEAAAKAAAPGWTRVRLRVHGGVARVHVRWRGPRALADLVDVRREVAFAPEARR